MNRGNFIAVLQLLSNGNSSLEKNKPGNPLCVLVDLSLPSNRHIKECLISFMSFERVNSSTREFWRPYPVNIRGQAYEGAAVMSSGIAMYTQCSLQSSGNEKSD